MDGRRIKRHFMSNSCDDTAPPVYIISGVSKYEIPNDDFLVIAVEGLCVGGYGVGGLKKGLHHENICNLYKCGYD